MKDDIADDLKHHFRYYKLFSLSVYQVYNIHNVWRQLQLDIICEQLFLLS